jgi:hypothetical protein
VIRSDGLVFTGEMYGLQVDLLAIVLGTSLRHAAQILARWRAAGWADADVLGPGPRWVWLTQAGLRTCGLPYISSAPGLSRLAHLRAVTATRLALEGTPEYVSGRAYWRSERMIRAQFGRRLGVGEHIPDGQVYWPDLTPLGWAGECWAIEAELTPKSLDRTTTIMRELLTRTGDYGCPRAQVRVSGQPPVHTRALYVCSPDALPVVARARSALSGLAAQILIRRLPESGLLPAPRTAGR